MSSDLNEVKSVSLSEEGSVGDRLGYEKDSKERMPWEHYLEEFRKADPKEISSRLSIPYDEAEKSFELPFLGSVYYISWPDFHVTHKEDKKWRLLSS